MSETRRLRYTGERWQSFTEHGVGEVEAGSEFDVPAEEAERYLRRPDIEEASRRQKRQPELRAAPDGTEPSGDPGSSQDS